MGYIGFSMSERAAQARHNGLLPATDLGKELGVSAAAIAATLRPAEWHHTSKHYNQTNFYAWPPVDEEGEECEALAAGMLAAMKAFDKARRAEIGQDLGLAAVRWIEWEGSRNRPKANVQTEWATITLKGKWCTITVINPDGTTSAPFRKGIKTNGFEFRLADGRTEWHFQS